MNFVRFVLTRDCWVNKYTDPCTLLIFPISALLYNSFDSRPRAKVESTLWAVSYELSAVSQGPAEPHPNIIPCIPYVLIPCIPTQCIFHTSRSMSYFIFQYFTSQRVISSRSFWAWCSFWARCSNYGGNSATSNSQKKQLRQPFTAHIHNSSKISRTLEDLISWNLTGMPIRSSMC